MAAANKIAVIDDDPESCELVRFLLKAQGHEVSSFGTAGKFFDALIKMRYALVVLDMRLPGMDGREIIRVLRANPETRGMLIVGMSAADIRSEDAVAALNLGADEYLTKPVDADFLVARVASLLRRSSDGASTEPERISVGQLLVIPDRHEASVSGKKVPLSSLEFQLLTYFLRNPNRVLTRQLILDQVWGVKTPLETRTVDKHVESLRRKLGKFGERIETVIKVGYSLKV